MKSEVDTLARMLNHTVCASIDGYQQLLLALSGGLDSTVLLDILTVLRDARKTSIYTKSLVLRATHVHHGLSPHADHWVEHCAQQCQLYNVPFDVLRICLNKKKTNIGIEAAARKARYLALRNHLLPNEVLLTAHHLDDQIETLLLSLKRGSGPAGLAAMAMDTPYYSHRLLRPLLSCNRIQLEAYAYERQLNWIEDNSNTDICHDRNFLRSHIIPILRQRWPWFNKTAARSARLCAEQEGLLDELLVETLATLIQPDGSLQVTKLLSMSVFRRRALLRRWLANQGARMPSYQQLDRIWQEVVLSRRDAAPQLRIDNYLLRRFHNRLYLLSPQIMLPIDTIVVPWLSVDMPLFLPQELGVVLRYIVPNKQESHSYNLSSNVSKDGSISTPSTPAVDALCTAISRNTGKNVVISSYMIRTPLPGEQVIVRFGGVSGLLHIVGRRHSRKLKKLWQELDVPPWLRKRIPLLFYDQVLIAALGVFITREGKANDEQNTHWLLYWLQMLTYPTIDQKGN